MKKPGKRKGVYAAMLCMLLVGVLALAASAADAGAAEAAVHQSRMYATVWSLLPPVIAIVLALITKEVYTSLFVGILAGGLFYANFDLELTVNTIFFGAEVDGEMTGGMVARLSESWNVGILIFLVVLGILVCLMNKAGGSAAFGRWAGRKIKSRAGAMLATMVLGILIFVDDYFNCLTVGSVMRPVTDKHKVSRAKLAYLIDATAAPICIIAPISSWAAAVTSSVPEGSGINGFAMFIQAIPYNFYALLTIVMMIGLAVMKFDYGPMKLHEYNAAFNNDLFTTEARPYGEADAEQEAVSSKGRVLDLVLPVAVLIVSCIIGMIYTGGFFEGVDFVTAFSDCDASVGLVLGSFVALVFTMLLYLPRRVLTFKQFTESIPEGFRAMVPAILILIFAWTLSGMTGLLGGAEFVGNWVKGSAEGFQLFLPAIIFLIAIGMSFSTGTSWGTFGILVPIVVAVFPQMDQMLILSISACLAGAVCGDHCSPISDTTIMASAGAQSDHINHVSTQLPYALTVAGVSFVCYLLAGFIQNAWIMLPIALVLMIGVLLLIRLLTKGQARPKKAK